MAIPKLRVPFDIPLTGIPRTNLMRNPSLESGLTFVSAYNDSGIDRQDSSGHDAPVGEYWVRSVANSTAEYGIYQETAAGSIDPEQTYVAAIYALGGGSGGDDGTELVLWWLDADGDFISAYGDGASTAESWRSLIAPAPANADHAALILASRGAVTAADEVWGDGFFLEQAETFDGYFDGSDSGYEWSGDSHLSVSEKVLPAAKASTVEQDSKDEIAQCVYAILATEPGTRTELTEFGYPSQLFRQGGADLEELRQVVETWEPRASILTEAEFSGLVETVKVNV